MLIEVLVSFLDLVLGGVREMLLIRATGCLLESNNKSPSTDANLDCVLAKKTHIHYSNR